MDGKIQILKRLELFLEFVSLWVLYTNQEFGCTGLLILCTTLPSLDSLWQELGSCCWISSYIFKTSNILAMMPMIDFLKIRGIMNMLKEKFNTVYYPFECITVDESLILFKGRLLFKHYIKSKKSRFGIKFYELSTADGILLDFILYQGNIQPSLI